MRRLGAAYIAVLCASAANAQEALPYIQQLANGAQHARNSIDVGTLESLTDAYMSQMLNFVSTGNLSQSGSNAINSVVYSGNLDHVVQRFNGTQSVSNKLALGVVDIFGNIDQTGKNLAGSVISNRLEFADQLFGANAQQLVLNSAEIAILYGSVGQYGTNIANFAEAAVAIGTATQTIELGAVQQIDNRLEVAAMMTVSAAITQKGENFGNIMISDTVDQVTRKFAGDQKVLNVVALGDGASGAISQHGSNIANLIMSSRIGSLTQFSSGRQEVINEVFDSQGSRVKGGDIAQTSDQRVNVIILTMPAEGGDSATINVDQTAEFPQSSDGTGSAAQTGNSLTVDR